MNNPVPQFGSPYIGMQNCGTDIGYSEMERSIMRALTQSINTQEVFLFPARRAAWYQEIASCYGLCQQPSRPFSLEIKL